MPASFTFYGAARDFVRARGPESILHGPAETGKTLSSLTYLHTVALKYPNANLLIVRKTQTSTYATVLRTYVNKVLLGDPARWKIEAYGGAKPEWFDYPNGSRIWVGGMDKASKILSSEFDIAYANQAEEFSDADWETLTTRTTGRAGNIPYSRCIGDANPAHPAHWMYNRPSLKLFYSVHKDNPALYDPLTGEITKQGRRTMEVLEALTGVRRVRLYEGKPAQAEGAIYAAWDEARHMVYREDVPPLFRFVVGIDWGYSNPGALQVWGIHGRSGAMYLVHEVYRANKTDDWWLEQAKSVSDRWDVEAFVCDPSEPAYIDKFAAAGLNAVKGFNSVLPGITAVQARLLDERLLVVRDSLAVKDERLEENRLPTCFRDEIPGYVWSSRSTKETPVKENDHALDAARYAVAYVDGLGRDTQTKPKHAKAWAF